MGLGLLLSRVSPQAVVALCVVLVLGTVGWQIDSRAYKRGFADADRQWKGRLEQELKRQDDANRDAMRIAQEQIELLEVAKDVRDATITRLIQEAAQDPDADRPSISTGSVRRLNSILD